MNTEELIQHQVRRENSRASGRDALAVYSDDEIAGMANQALGAAKIAPDYRLKAIMLSATSYLSDELLRRKEDRHNAEHGI